MVMPIRNYAANYAVIYIIGITPFCSMDCLALRSAVIPWAKVKESGQVDCVTEGNFMIHSD